MSRILAVDPGKSGGIVVLDESGAWQAHTRMPEPDRELFDFIVDSDAGLGVLEWVRASPQQGVTSAFTFGGEYRRARMAIVAAGIPLHEVKPKEWQAGMGVKRPKKTSDTTWKNMLKAAAQEIFPEVPITLAIADAALMAEWARREGILRKGALECAR